MSAPTHSRGPVPVLELCKLQTLADELGDFRPALRFLTTYISLLPARLHRIVSGFQDQDAEASLDAVLSLRVSSAYVGALETEAQCLTLESLIREDRLTSAADALSALQQHIELCSAAGPDWLASARKCLCPEVLDLAED
ncbi:Hpt domain-containing protein [Paenarthrobacter sp. NPDC092416]|uniref:Hpt domain-containing protein n=1 Tax=Paenarthrobacter sp. NPDC092416 TaxID=3364386 RepID=UPI0037F5C8EF